MTRKYEKITISFTEADSDMVEYLEGLKKSNKASEFIREAIREKMNRSIGLSENNGNFSEQMEDIEKRINNIESLILNNNISLNATYDKGKINEASNNKVSYDNELVIKDVEDKVLVDEKVKTEIDSKYSNDDNDEDLISAVDYFDF